MSQIPSVLQPMTAENFTSSYLKFENRQAGISLVYSPEEQVYTYNVYCIERDLLKELFSVEFDYLDDAIDTINAEFGTWELKNYDRKKNCGSCVAKK